MPPKTLSTYLRQFSKLRTDRSANWSAATQHQAPHKPFLLLAVLDLFAQGKIATNLIQVDSELGELFAGYWSRVMPRERRGNLALPFFHLRSSSFWHLVPVPGQEAVLKAIRQVAMEQPAFSVQRSGEAEGALIADGCWLMADCCEHRCAFCGVRMLTVEGRTAVEAAHIIPWSVSHNDDVHNGIALCRLCHWTFDEGLAGISKKYLVVLSQEMRISQNLAGHLLTLEGRSILGPAERDLWPDVRALGWHRENVFRGV